MQRVCFKQMLSTIFLSLFFIFLLFPGEVKAQQQIGLDHDLFSVSFPTELDGWACGRWGSVLHTADGGKTWVRQDSTTDYTLSSIYFVDPQNGLAVGDGGTIIRTTDGGETWQIQFSDVDFILKSVSFCDKRNGWSVGEYGYIYHTDDGGRTWENQAGEFGFSEKTGEIIGGNFLFDVFAIAPNTAWVVGIDGYVAKTFDGGATWQRVTNGVPKTHLFGITSDRKGTIIIGGDALLLTSSDGGENFRPAEIEPSITYGWIYRIARRGEAGFVAVGKKSWIYLSDSKGISWRREKNR